jgi:hypothetical protein
VRKGLVGVLALWLVSAGQLFAQSPLSTTPAGSDSKQDAAKSTDSTSTSTTTKRDAQDDCCGPDRFWARPAFVLWWVKDSPLPVPLVTTGDPNVGFDPNLVKTVNTAGAIGQPGTHVLFGGDGVSFPAFSGMRLALGGWLDDAHIFGIEGDGFILERCTKTFALTSDSNPPLYFPIFSEIAGAERAIPIADPLRAFSGDVVINTTLQFWGADINGSVSLFRDMGLEVTLLAGFRYADLREELQIHNTTTDLLFGNVTTLGDFFNTINQFYGGQIGSRVALQYDRFSVELTGKIALGATHEVVDIQGAITQFGPNPLVPPGLGTFPGGIYTQTTNIGQRSADDVAVLGSLQLNIGFDITHRVRAFAGYDIVYWSQVVRPGNQVSHNVNLSQNAVLDPNGVGTLVGPAQPAPLFNSSDFWAQGISLGLEIRF